MLEKEDPRMKHIFNLRVNIHERLMKGQGPEENQGFWMHNSHVVSSQCLCKTGKRLG